MSELTQLKDSVLTQANEKGQLKLERAQQEHTKEYEHKREQLLHEKEVVRRQKINEIKGEHMRLMQQIANQQRLTSLNSKQQVLDALFNGAVDTMTNWTNEEHLLFIQRVLSQYGETESTLIFGSLTKENLTEENLNHLKKQHPNVTILEKSIPREAGFVLTEGRIDYNYLYTELVIDTRKVINLQIAKEVFGEE